jgi:hypothetical protein
VMAGRPDPDDGSGGGDLAKIHRLGRYSSERMTIP